MTSQETRRNRKKLGDLGKEPSFPKKKLYAVICGYALRLGKCIRLKWDKKKILNKTNGILGQLGVAFCTNLY